MCDSTVDFSVLCSMLEAVVRSKKPALKRKHLRTFLDHVYTDREFFSALRLILPALDKERGTYGLKEVVLAKCLSDALGLSKESEDAKKLLNWRKGGAQAGANAGNFPLVAAEVLFRRQNTSSGGMKIKVVNDYLDRLASAESREEKASVLAELITKTNAQEMRWIIMFILKDLKLGISEKTVFHEFHPDAEDLFNVTCDLKLVCEKLKDRNQRYKRQDIEVGKPVRPQLASRVADVDEAWRKLRGKQMVVECKFDGDRIQVHKNGNDIHFFSRNFIDHAEFREAISSVILQQVKIDKCILDGEMLVWNMVTNRFADFGSNQEIAKAAKDGLETDQQLCYVAFDILYAGDSSVIHQGLRQRQQLLQKVVQPLKGRLELILPDNGINSHRLPDKPQWSMLVHSADEAQKFFLETVENRDEGVVIKDLDSKWEPGDRSGKWLKLKPDYIHTGSDLDALIIGCYFGSGRRGGEVGQFLLGLAERPKSGGHPTRFLSFCKVGSGLSDSERDLLVSKIKPYLRRNDNNAKTPSFYTVTNSAKERPDLWIDQPEKSIILEITSDIRTIKSEVFATPYSLRFPRVHRVRYDKPWYDCLDVQSLVELVQSRSGSTADVKEYGNNNRPRRSKLKKEVKLMPLVPSHMLVTDVSQVKQETSIFKGLVFYFINVQQQYSKDILHKLVVENGGSFSMNMNDTVTHAVAAEKKGIRYQAAVLHRDIIHESWVIDCCTQKALLPFRPKYILHLSTDSRVKMNDEMDEFGDSYIWDLDVADLRQLFQNMDTIELPVRKEDIYHFQRKYCQTQDLCHFCGCGIYFHRPIHSVNMDSQMAAEITLKRLELEVLMHEGEVKSSLRGATHMIIYTAVDNTISFSNIMKSVTNEERKLLKSEKLHIVKHAWLEDSLTSNRRVAEDGYKLRDLAETDYDEEEVLSPGNAFGKGHLVPDASRYKKSRKTAPSSMRGGDSSSETDEITPRRQLYRSAISKGKSKTKRSFSDKVKDVVKTPKERKTSKKQKNIRHDLESEYQENSNGAGEKGISSAFETHDAETQANQKGKMEAGNPTRKSDPDNDMGNSLQAMLADMIPSFGGLQEKKCQEAAETSEGDIHCSGNQDIASNVNAEDVSCQMARDVVTAGKKKKVSYKSLVGNFLDA